MTESILSYLAIIATAIEIAGAIALMSGFVIVTFKCAKEYLCDGWLRAIQNYRRSLARVVLIGLEILVAATIIKTIAVDPTLNNLSLLAIMVLIRVLIGWTMVLDIEGHWPWNKINKDSNG